MTNDLNQIPRELGGQSGNSRKRGGCKPACLRSKNTTIKVRLQVMPPDLSRVKSSELVNELFSRLDDERLIYTNVLQALEGGGHE